MSEWTKEGMLKAIRENPDNPNLDAFLSSAEGLKFGLKAAWDAEQGKTATADESLQADAPPGVTVVAEDPEAVEEEPVAEKADRPFDMSDADDQADDAAEQGEMDAGYAEREQELDGPWFTPNTFFPDGYEPSVADFVGNNKPYLHKEPSVAQADDYYLRMLGPGPEMNQIRRQLKAKGEKSEAYSRAADTLWDRVREVHERHTLPVVRVEYWEGDGLAPGLVRLLQRGDRGRKALRSGWSRTATLGMGAPMFAMAEEAMTDDSVAVQELREEGTIQGFVEENEAQASRDPSGQAVGSLIGLVSPGSIAKMAYSVAGPALPAQAGMTGAGAGLEEMATAGLNLARNQAGAGPVEKGWPMVEAPEFPSTFDTDPAQTGPAMPDYPGPMGGYQAGQAPLPSMGEVAGDAASSAIAGAGSHMALGGMLKGAGALGRANRTSLRHSDRGEGADISKLERDPSLGKGGAFTGIGGVKAPGGVQRAQAGRAAGTTGLGDDATSAEILSGGKGGTVDKILRSLGKRATVAENRMTAETNQVLDRAGSKPTVDLGQLVKTVDDYIADATRRVRTLKTENPRLALTTDKAGKSKISARKDVKVSTEEMDEVGVGGSFLTEMKKLRVGLSDKKNILRPDGTKSQADLPRKMTLRRFDDLTKRIDDLAKKGTADTSPEAGVYKHFGKVLRDIRNTDGVPKEYVALKARHWNELRAEQNIRTGFGLRDKPAPSPDGTYAGRDFDAVESVVRRGNAGAKRVIEDYRKLDREVDISLAEHDAALAYSSMLRRGEVGPAEGIGFAQKSAHYTGKAAHRGRHAYDSTYHYFKRLEDKTGMLNTATKGLSREVPTTLGRKTALAIGTAADDVTRWVSRTYDRTMNEMGRTYDYVFGNEED